MSRVGVDWLRLRVEVCSWRVWVGGMLGLVGDFSWQGYYLSTAFSLLSLAVGVRGTLTSPRADEQFAVGVVVSRDMPCWVCATPSHPLAGPARAAACREYRT